MQDMLTLVERFPTQLHEALQIGQKYKFIKPRTTFQNVILTGLGGSGIGGSMVQNYVADKMKIPFTVNKDYFLPVFAGKETLVIVCSYSGNTEETLMALKTAAKKGCHIVCITSGGALAEWAKAKKTDCILLPSGMPPRSCLGYSLIQILFALKHHGLINSSFQRDIKLAADHLLQQQKNIAKEAQKIATQLYGKLPIIYAETQYEGVAVRFRQQLNENSKLLCWHHVIPEMNHNELVGWRDDSQDKVVVFLRFGNEYERNTQRIRINTSIIKKYCNNIINLPAKGNGYWQQIMHLVHLTDFVSVHLANLRQQNATEVAVIDFLKGSLAKKG